MIRQGLQRAAVMTAVLALTLASCGGEPKGSAAPGPTNTLTITGTDYKFALDKPSIREGTARLTFKNAGNELHVVGWQRLKAGTTFAAFSEAVGKDWESAMGLSEGTSGLLEDQEADGATTGLLSPGQQTTLTVGLLKAGSYALLCYLPSSPPDERPHLARGMVAGVEVQKGPTPAPKPVDVKADGEVNMSDFSFGTLPAALRNGKGTIKFTNSGKEPHNATLVRFESGKTFKDLDASIEAFFGHEEAPPPRWPVVFLGGFNSIPPGVSVWVTIDLPPGTYGLECDEVTAADKEHGRGHGMRVTFDVA